jgi:hypothetical protein
MLTLYSYPTLFGVADNNAYGLRCTHSCVDTHDNMVRHCRAIHAKVSGS